MTYKNFDLSQFAHGAYQTKCEDGYTYFYRFDDNSISYFNNNPFFSMRTLHSASIFLEFVTTSETVGFTYKIDLFGSYDSVELYINGMAYDIKYVNSIPAAGRLDYKLPSGEKTVTVYFPVDARMGIGELELDEGVSCTPIKRDKKVLFMGDSITHGYGPLRSSMSYVNILNRNLPYEIINQGIGGYIYEGEAVRLMDGYTPDSIFVALGTNGFDAPDYDKKLNDFFNRLDIIYKNIPTTVITPLWRGDVSSGDGGMLSILEHDAETIVNIAGKYDYIKTMNGFNAVPHLKEYFLDLLHPNALGMEIYAQNIIAYLNLNNLL